MEKGIGGHHGVNTLLVTAALRKWRLGFQKRVLIIIEIFVPKEHSARLAPPSQKPQNVSGQLKRRYNQ